MRWIFLGIVGVVACKDSTPAPVPRALEVARDAVVAIAADAPIDAAIDAPIDAAIDAPPADAPPKSVMDESIGPIWVGMDKVAAEAAIGTEPSKRYPVSANQAFPGWSTAVEYATGETVHFMGPERAGPFTVSSIELRAPSAWKTRRGIGIGSTGNAVRAAYGKLISKDESSDEAMVAGSIYDGVGFSLSPKGLVTEICACAAF